MPPDREPHDTGIDVVNEFVEIKQCLVICIAMTF